MVKKIILASASPRRKELLSQVGLNFEIIVSAIDENLGDLEPEVLVQELALLKASAVARKVALSLVIGSDTVVVLEDKVLGKPRDQEEAKVMLRNLSGRVHKVITGLAVIDTETDKTLVTCEVTEVSFKILTDREIEKYVATGEPMDKAGAYAIQGLAAIFVEKINGCYFNVVGLPLHKLNLILGKFGVTVI